MKSWKVIAYIRHLFCEPSKTASNSKFVDLAPTVDADNAEIYFEALNYATNNDDVFNIALTGPYGSGKSSVIKSFLAKYPGRSLSLSLASFLPEGDTPGVRVSKQEIERSILQQILYGVEADKLPFSRFKRIQTPKSFSIFSSLFITAALACAWYILGKQTEIMSGSFFVPWELSKWFNYLCLVVAAAFSWKAIHTIYTTSFGLSLKGISLKDVQIAPAAANEESILNKHFDEILYFFQSTNYDLVVIEDLDRFDNPDIFVTLREINGLINANEGIKRRIRFLYALRDDIFINTDRTKFFEFIVPIIPIINHSNSIDKVLEQGQRIDLDARLNKQFVREVSRYLTDLRLIRNIFNEYVVYSVNLKADGEGLDPNKLLAVLIYKNVIPKDFAELHRQEGVLSRILGRYDEYISKIEREIRTERTQIESNLAKGDAQFLRDQTELRKVYAMAVLQQLPVNIASLITGDGQVPWGQLSESPLLEVALTQSSIKYRDNNGYTREAQLSPVEAAVDPTRSFAERKAEIDLKTAEFKQKSEKRLLELKAELAPLRTRRFNEVVRESAELIEEIFAEVGENRELLKYLILEGYLDDTYYQYISLFHQGRLSPNDNNFLIQIRGYNNPSPDFPIDNTGEVIASMRDEDFGHHYVLNRFIIDHLLSEPVGNLQRVSSATDFIAMQFADCGEFFRSYYAKGAQVRKLIQALSARRADFAVVALSGTDAVSHAARILAYMPDGILTKSTNAAELKTFLSDRMRQVLLEGLDFDIGRLSSLSVEIDDISDLADFPTALSFVVQNGLYRISIDNIRYIVGHILNWQKTDNLEKQHFSTLKDINDLALLKRINEDFQVYVIDVLLLLEGNTDEEWAAILEVLNRDDVELELRATFLKKQRAVIPSFDKIPSAFHGIVLEENKIEPSWENCVGFMNSEAYDPDLLTTYLQVPSPGKALAAQPVPRDDAFIGLCKFIAGNNALNSQVYRSYVRQLSRYFTYIPEVDADKLKILIEEHKLGFVPEIFRDLPDIGLKVLFVASNFAAYEAKEDDFAIDDEFRSSLLQTGISDAQKLKLIKDMDQSYVAGASHVASAIGPVLDRSPIDANTYGVDFIKAVIQNSRSVEIQISLFNKLHRALSDSEVRDVLQKLPLPFRDIATYGKKPKIENSGVNRQLASWLKQRNIISTFNADSFKEIKINTYSKER